MKNKKQILTKKYLTFLRALSGWWGWLTFLIFIYDFFTLQKVSAAVSTSAVIYGVILALYVGNKEVARWSGKKGEYKSLYFGELYIFVWSAALFVFVIISALTHGFYEISSEFPATYITILGIYVLSQQSKLVYHNK